MTCNCTTLSPGQNCDCGACAVETTGVVTGDGITTPITLDFSKMTNADAQAVITRICGDQTLLSSLRACVQPPLLSALPSAPTGGNPSLYIDDSGDPDVLMMWDDSAVTYKPVGGAGAIVPATSTTPGVIRIATAAEAENPTIADVAMTPQQVHALVGRFMQNPAP